MVDRKHPLALCEKCPFGDKGGYVPTYNLTPSSRIAVIGEAPGAYEAVYGIPFTGPSGELLDSVLKHHNIQRSDIMISNIVSCRPQANEDPPKSAISACAPRLQAEIAQSGIDTILAVGKVSANNLLGEKTTMKKLMIHQFE
jgi:DNA polymerase